MGWRGRMTKFMINWGNLTSIYTQLCAWRLLQNKLATKDNLHKRAMQLSEMRCIVC